MYVVIIICINVCNLNRMLRERREREDGRKNILFANVDLVLVSSTINFFIGRLRKIKHKKKFKSFYFHTFENEQIFMVLLTTRFGKWKKKTCYVDFG